MYGLPVRDGRAQGGQARRHDVLKQCRVRVHVCMHVHKTCGRRTCSVPPACHAVAAAAAASASARACACACITCMQIGTTKNTWGHERLTLDHLTGPKGYCNVDLDSELEEDARWAAWAQLPSPPPAPAPIPG